MSQQHIRGIETSRTLKNTQLRSSSRRICQATYSFEELNNARCGKIATMASMRKLKAYQSLGLRSRTGKIRHALVRDAVLEPELNATIASIVDGCRIRGLPHLDQPAPNHLAGRPKPETKVIDWFRTISHSRD